MYLSVNRRWCGWLSHSFLQADPALKIGWRLQMTLHQRVEERPSRHSGERLVDANRRLLIREFDHVGGARIELAAVAGGLIFVRPGHGIGPYLGGAPGVVAHDDDRGRVPLIFLLEQLTDMGKVNVGKSEVVDVRGVGGRKDLLFPIVESVGVWDGHVQKEEVDGGIGEERVASTQEIAVVHRVLTYIAVLIRRRARTTPE